jgi:membrane-associated protein
MSSLAASASTVLANPISPDHLLTSFGVIGLAVVIFAECGLLVGFFLPGDTILIAAGIKLSLGDHKLAPLWVFLLVIPLAAIVGNLGGYIIGRRAGPVVFDRPNSRLFKPEYVTRSQAIFDKWGLATIVVARFIPIVRTVVPPMAGVARMPIPRFTAASVVGGLIWSDGILLAGYWLGHIGFVQRNKGKIDYLVLAVVVLALLPPLFHLVRSRKGRTATPTD